MAFPQDVLPLRVELDLNGWTAVTSDVYRQDMVNISRGRSDDASQVERSTATMTINNRSGDYSPRNPMSPYYGVLGRNTRIRIAVESGDMALFLQSRGDRLTCPDAAALGVTGDVDLRIELELDSWRLNQDLAAKHEITGDQRSWSWWLNDDGTMAFRWSTAGTSGSLISDTSTAPVPIPGDGRQGLRVTLDVNNGSAGHTTTFYYSDSISGSWTQLGDPVVTAGTTSIFDSTAGIELGSVDDLTNGPAIGRIYQFQMRNGIAGTVVANPNLTIQTRDDNSFADTASSPNTWTVAGDAAVTDRRYRFHGEVVAWPQSWDSTGEDVHVAIEAAGILQRLSKGSRTVGSALYRGRLMDTEGLVAYWPFEDAEGSLTMAPALNHSAMTIIGSPELASFDSFVASNPIPVLNGAEMRGSCPAYTDTGQTQLRFLMAVPAAGAEDGQVVMMWYTTGSVRRWEIFYGTGSGGTLGLRGFDSTGTSLFTTGAVAFAVNGELLLVSAELTQDGADIDYALATLEPGAAAAAATSGTLASNTVGRVGTVDVSPGGGIDGIAIGHVSVQNAVTDIFDLGDQLEAWAGETAGRRIERLCGEESVTFRSVGNLDDSARMGVQLPSAWIDLVRQAELTDGGMLFEPREVFGLGYRTRVSLYNQDSAVTLDYDSAELAGSLSTTDDDQRTKNDITVNRDGGSSARAVLETGALSVLDPPDGVGRYEDPVTISPETDLHLFDQASWRLHLGTVDEARYPQIVVNLARSQIAGDAALTAEVVGTDVGDRLVVTDPPSGLPPEDISQLIQGYTETLGNYEWEFTTNTSPASPYEVATYGSSRYGPHDTVTAEALDTTEVGVDITTPTGPLWSTTATGYDVMVGGERMTVTAVSAPSGTNQTLTVTRSVNGIVKSHDSGAQVQLFEPAIYAL